MAGNELAGHAPGELRLMVRQERLALLQELTPLKRRVAAIHERLEELQR